MASIRVKVRDRTDRRYAGLLAEVVVADLNPVLRGWGNYFRWGNSSQKFTTIDNYVHERLAILASAKIGRRGRSWAHRLTYAWFCSLGVHRLSGTIRYYPAAHAWR
jgi:hypothetical protein